MSQRATGTETAIPWSARDARRGLLDAALGGRATRRAALAALVAAFGGTASGATITRGAGNKGNGRRRRPKVPICHAGQTLLLPIPAAKAHLKHGDTPGPCGLEGGACVPLLQICAPLVGNPCCDASAECLAPHSHSDIPLFFCVDSTDGGCATDAECQTRFNNPDMVCDKPGPFTCKQGVQRCCQRKECDVHHQCQGGAVCCTSGGSALKSVCCAPGQICNDITGCVTP